jgi:hypothetical protein
MQSYTLMPFSAFVWLFQMEPGELQALEDFAATHSPMLLKLMVLLLRQQAIYLLRPMVANLELLSRHNCQADIACWSWSVWLQLSVWMKDLLVALSKTWPSAPSLPLPCYCWVCAVRATGECPQCETFMIRQDMRPVPICQSCRLCAACRQDSSCGQQPSSAEDRFRFSFRFRRAAWLALMSVQERHF